MSAWIETPVREEVWETLEGRTLMSAWIETVLIEASPDGGKSHSHECVD